MPGLERGAPPQLPSTALWRGPGPGGNELRKGLCSCSVRLRSRGGGRACASSLTPRARVADRATGAGSRALLTDELHGAGSRPSSTESIVSRRDAARHGRCRRRRRAARVAASSPLAWMHAERQAVPQGPQEISAPPPAVVAGPSNATHACACEARNFPTAPVLAAGPGLGLPDTVASPTSRT